MIVSAVCDDLNPIEFHCEILTWYIFHELWYWCWLFSSNDEDPYIGYVSSREIVVTWFIVGWLGDIVYVVMLKVLGNYSNMSFSWWRHYSNFKNIMFDKGVVWEIHFNVGRVEIFDPIIDSELGDHHFPSLLLCSSNFSDEPYLSFLVCGPQNFIVALLLV